MTIGIPDGLTASSYARRVLEQLLFQQPEQQRRP